MSEVTVTATKKLKIRSGRWSLEVDTEGYWVLFPDEGVSSFNLEDLHSLAAVTASASRWVEAES